jgi:wobble nucleotide-excising tRNase
MIKKILKIKGVGLLHDAIPNATKFFKITTIYGENGRGKTTLGSIFSSLANNNPSLIYARRTINGINNPEIEILINNIPHKFYNNNWDRTYDKITIFDSAFVDANVYSGFNVSSDQRVSLLEFTLGEMGGELKQNVDDLTEKISEKTSRIRESRGLIDKIGYPLPLESYIEIQPDPKIDEKIFQNEKLLEFVKNVDEICKKPSLAEIRLPVPNFDILKELFSVSLSTISTEAKQRVNDHINAHLKVKNEQWIKDGLHLVKSDNCPFCGQNLDGSSQIIELYQQYFDESYQQHQYKLKTFQKILQDTISDDIIIKLQHTYEMNNSIYEDNWNKRIKTELDKTSVSNVKTEIQNIREMSQDLIKKKISNPISAIEISPQYDSALKRLKEIPSLIEKYNQHIQKINNEIEEFKHQLRQTDLSVVQRNNDQLKMSKQRFEPPNVDLCYEYKELQKNKALFEREKEEAKANLIRYTNNILEQFEEEINQYLIHFNAGFRIVNIDTSHERGFPRIKYELQLRNHNIELGSSEGAFDRPGFSNTLSEGDKRTLAFAFFLARTTLDSNLNEKIIIADDPISSLDQSRQFTTQMALISLASKSKQLIVLSHDPRFLQSFLENGFFPQDDVATLELKRSDDDYTIITECDLEDCIQTAYKKNYRTVFDYVIRGQYVDKILVVRAIRPLVEATLRFRYLDTLKGADSLGKMIGLIEQSQNDSPVFRARVHLSK